MPVSPLSPDNVGIKLDPKPASPNIDADIERVNALLAKPWTRWDLEDRKGRGNEDDGSPGRAYEVTHLTQPARDALEAAFKAIGWDVGHDVPRLNTSYMTPDDGRRWLVFIPAKARRAAMLKEVSGG